MHVKYREPVTMFDYLNLVTNRPNSKLEIHRRGRVTPRDAFIPNSVISES